MKRRWKALAQLARNWKGWDYTAGILTGAIGMLILEVIFNVNPRHIWDLLRLNWVDMLLTGLAVFLWRYCYMLFQARGIPKYKTTMAMFWDRNWLGIALAAAGALCIALIDPQMTARIINLVK